MAFLARPNGGGASVASTHLSGAPFPVYRALSAPPNFLSWEDRLIPRSVIVLAIAAVGFAALVGTERAASRQSGSNRIVVTYWEKWTGDEMEAMRKVVDGFNRSQDRIEVKYLSISGIADKTLLATSGGNPPDVAGLWADQVIQFADAGALTDLSELARQSGLTESQYIPSYWRSITYKGKLFALPTSPGTSALYVNRDLMPAKYNSPEKFPKTLSKFEEMVKEVSVKNPDGTLKVAAFLPRQGYGTGSWPYLFGGSFEQDGSVKVDSDADIKAWEWVHSYAKRFGIRETQSFTSGFGNYSSPQNPFLSGKLVCYVDGPWFSNFINLFNPNVHWFAVPFPYLDGHPELAGYTVLNLNTLMIPRGAKHPKEAFEFMAYVQKQDVMESLCKAQRCNSPLSAVSQSFFDTHPNKAIRVFDALARSPRAFGAAPFGIYNQIGQEVSNAVDLMDLGQVEPAEALHEAQRRLDKNWAKYKIQVLEP